jgi:hypothetical protein
LIELRETSISLRQSLEELTSELEVLRKKANREVTVNNVQDSSKVSSSKDLAAIKGDLKCHKEEIKGHK